MDLNLVVLVGRLTMTPELHSFETGGRLMRFLLAIRSEEPKKRLDVLPITLWNPSDELVAAPPEPQKRLWLLGSVQRRFWDSQDGRRSKLEIVAEHVNVRDPLEAPLPTS